MLFSWGAGASRNSGYPLANGLRLLISSRKKWEEALAKYEVRHNLSGRPIAKLGLDYWAYHVVALDLFRKGGFATVDEFCKLAQPSYQSETNNLRSLLRIALGLFNPEENFEQSEYYSFIQSLFKDDLFSLREDVVVLSYNYDPYLEFLLYRALAHRFKVIRRLTSPLVSNDDIVEIEEHQQVINTVTSGFGLIGDQKWLGDENTKPNFCVLKLHGSIVNTVNLATDFKILFSEDEGDVLRRAEKLFGANEREYTPPILFPWEIMNEKGFIENDSFPLPNAPALYSLFRGIWERARREVQTADKISFVGLSMHSYLIDGLKFLFNGKGGKVEVCVANPDNVTFVPGRTETHWNNLPNSPAYAVSKILDAVAPNMGRWGKLPKMSRSDGDITLVNDFTEFVKTQMKPFSL
jgi:hypothetical protein